MTHKLRSYREGAGITLAAMAGQVGLSKSTLSRIETGHMAPSLSTVSRIIAATGGAVSADDFLPHDQEDAA